MFVNGLFLFQIESFNGWGAGEKWYKMVFGIVLEYAAGLSLSMMFWNLTYQYWVSAQTLLFFQHHFDRQQDVDDLKS